MNSFLWYIGLIGNILLSSCGFPLLYDTIKSKKHTSVNFLLTWGLGEVFAAIYAAWSKISWFITLNYCLSIVLILLVLIFQSRKKGYEDC